VKLGPDSIVFSAGKEEFRKEELGVEWFLVADWLFCGELVWLLEKKEEWEYCVVVGCAVYTFEKEEKIKHPL
jgi:hypothetical protein